jgi:hypothetical protein
MGSCGEPPDGPISDDDMARSRTMAEAVSAEGALVLALTFRPRLYFDEAEHWRPLDVDAFAEETFSEPSPHHRLCGQKETDSCDSLTALGQLDPRAARGVESAVLAAPARVLDVHGRAADRADYGPPTGVRCPHIVAKSLAPITGATPEPIQHDPPFAESRVPAATTSGIVDCTAAPATMYANVTWHRGRFLIDYWWFLRYNDYPRTINSKCHKVIPRSLCGDHEGDWEGVTVATDPFATEVSHAFFATHKGVRRHEPPRLAIAGTHISVYVATGSHASYTQPCKTGHCRQHNWLPEGRHNGAVDWEANDDAACGDTCVRLLPDLRRYLTVEPSKSATGWNAWPGRWGRDCTGKVKACGARGNPGPNSPGRQPRYRVPWSG